MLGNGNGKDDDGMVTMFCFALHSKARVELQSFDHHQVCPWQLHELLRYDDDDGYGDNEGGDGHERMNE